MEVKVKREVLRELIEKAAKYDALTCGGVDNWSFYYDSLDNYVMTMLDDEEKGYNDFGELADKMTEVFINA